VVLVDASNLGTKIKDGKNQKTLLSDDEEQRIINTVNDAQDDDEFSVVKAFADLKAGKYSFNPGSYFDIQIVYSPITDEEFQTHITSFETRFEALIKESHETDDAIIKALRSLRYESK